MSAPASRGPLLSTPLGGGHLPVGEFFAFKIPAETFASPDETLTYSASLGDGSPLPVWLSFNPASRVLSGTPPSDGPEGTLNLRITATDSQGRSVSDTVPLTLVGRNSLSGSNSAAIAVSGSTAYVAAGDQGLRVLNIADPRQPVEIGSVDTAGEARDVVVSGTHAYVADLTGLAIIDVSDPAHPVQSARISLGSFYPGSPFPNGYVASVAVQGSTAYLGDLNNGLWIVDVSDPGAPQLRASYRSVGGVVSVAVAGNALYVVSFHGLSILDVSNAASPSFLASYSAQSQALAVSVYGNTAYLLCRTGLEIIDVSNPSHPSRLSSYNHPAPDYWYFGIKAPVKEGNTLYLATNNAGIHVLDVADPAAPILKQVIDGNQQGYYPDLEVAGSRLLALQGYGDLLNISRDQIDATPERSEPLLNWDLDLPPAYLNRPYSYTLPDQFILDPGDSLVFSASLPDGSPLPADFSFDPASRTITGSPISTANLNIRITATDSENQGAEDTGLLSVLTGFASIPYAAVVGVAVEGAYAYVAAGYSGIQAIAIQNPQNPLHQGSSSAGSGFAYINQLVVIGSYAYVASNAEFSSSTSSRLEIYSLSDPANPQLIGFQNVDPINALAKHHDQLLVATGNAVAIYSLVSPASPVLLNRFAALPSSSGTSDSINSLLVSGDWLYVGSESGIRVFNISAPDQLSEVEQAVATGQAGSVTAMALSQGSSAAGILAAASGNQVMFFSTAEPAKPEYIHTYSFGDSYNNPIRDLQLDGNYLYLSRLRDGVLVLDISDPSQPLLVDSISTPGMAGDLALGSDGQLYIADGESGLQIAPLLGSTPPARPNLRITQASIQGQSDLFSKISLSYSVSNDGSSPTTSNQWLDRIFLSKDNILDAGDNLLATDVGSDVDPGSAYQRSLELSLYLGGPANNVVGDVFLLLKTDAESSLPEVNEFDNYYSLPITIFAANLQPTFLDAPDYVDVNSEFTVGWSVANNGLAATATSGVESTWQDSLVFSTNAIYGDNDDVALRTLYQSGSIGSGVSYDTSVSLYNSLPMQAMHGGYLLLKTDSFPTPGGQITESDESDNVIAKPITLTAADFQVDAISFPATLSANQTFDLSWTISNVGTAAPEGYWIDHAVFSANDTYGDSDDISLIYYFNNSSISPYESQGYTRQVTLPSQAIGSGHLILRTNIQYLYRESDFSNNTIISPLVTIAAPDLVPTAVTPTSTTIAALQPIPLNWTIQNNGSAITVPAWYDRIHFSRNEIFGDSDDLYLADVYVNTGSGLLPGESIDQSVSIQIPVVGEGYLLVKSDVYNVQGEINEDNNVSVSPLLFIDAADLVVSAINAPTEVAANQDLTISWVVDNIGNVNTTTGGWYETIVYSTDPYYGDGNDVFLGVAHTSQYAVNLPMDPLASYTGSASFSLPSQAFGEGWLIVATDNYPFAFSINNLQPEVNEANNYRATPIVIGVPNLTVASLSAPSAATEGQSIDLAWTVSNTGAFRMGASFWEDRIYLSADEFLSADDVQLGSVLIANGSSLQLQPGDAYTRNATVTIPTSFTASGGYLLIQTDVYSQQTESNESDNLFSQRLDYLPSPGTIAFASAETVASEGSDLAITLSRSLGSAGEVTVQIIPATGTATAGSDFDATAIPVTFADGETSKTITIPILADQQFEFYETFSLTLDQPTGGAVLGAQSTSRVLITPPLTLNGSARQTQEGSSNTPVLRLTDFYGQGGSAFLSDRISLEANASFSTAFSFRIGTDPYTGGDDDGPGADGLAFVVQTVANNVGGAGGGLGYAGIPNSIAVEYDTYNNGGIDQYSGNHVGIDLNGDIASAVLVPLARRLNDGDVWWSWVDYNGVTNQLEVRLADTDQRPIDPLLSYSIDLLPLLQTANAYVGFSSGTGGAYGRHDILSWDFASTYNPFSPGRFSFSAASSTVLENSSTAAITVLRSDGSRGEASVTLTLSDGSATAPDDYASSVYTISFADGETSKTIQVPIVNDDLFESHETLLLQLSDPTGGASLGTISNAVLTIRNDDPLPPQIASTTAVINEDSQLTISLDSLLPAGTDPSLSNLSITAITASSNGQAVIQEGTLIFTPNADANGTGEVSYTIWDGYSSSTATLTITINPVNDAPAGADRTITTVEATQSDLIFTDTFDQNSPGFNPLPVGWQITGENPGSVDVIGSGYFDFLPGHGYYLDLDGSSGNAAVLTRRFDVTPGKSYTLTFDLAGNQRGGEETVDVAFGSSTASFVVVSFDPFMRRSLSWTADADTVDVVFHNQGGDNIGALLDNVSIWAEGGSSAPAYTFSAADFGFSDPLDAASAAGANRLQSVVISQLPSSGLLRLGTVGVMTGQEISATDLSALAYFAQAHANGTASDFFTFQVRDDGGTAEGGVDLDAIPNTIHINTTPLNDAPSGSDATITIAENTSHSFTATDFGFTDPIDAASASGANSLQSVIISTLPTAGSLELAGVAVVTGQEIDAADLANLSFMPAPGALGSGYASFTFQVRDNGGTANGGVDLDPTPNTFTINVGAINHEPAGSDGSLTILEDSTYQFTAADFGFSDPGDASRPSGAHSLQSIVISELPSLGILQLDGSPLLLNQEIAAADLPRLVYAAPANVNGNASDSFRFQVRDNGGTFGGGVDIDATPNTLTIDLTPVNDAPSGANKIIRVPGSSSYSFTAADFGFSDSADASSASGANSLQSVILTSLPAAGTLSLNGAGVSIGQEIQATELPSLVFVAPAYTFGAASPTLGFRVRDDGGTSSGGADLESSTHSLQFKIPSAANEIFAVSYSMLNGQSDLYNYWDESYSGVGDRYQDFAYLSGGTGDLSDGFIAASNWHVAEAPSDSGPYVGWRDTNPTITFDFAAQVNLDTVTIYVDDANGYGGVRTPESVHLFMGGNQFDSGILTDPASAQPLSYTFTNLGFSGSSLELTLNRRSNSWVFLSEVTFHAADTNVSPGSFSFSSSAYTVNESGAPAQAITVLRSAGSDGAVRVRVDLDDGSVTAPYDYNNAPIFLDFADGETSKTFTLPIVNDTDPETSETLLLSLANPTNGAVLGAGNTAVVTIIDDDLLLTTPTVNAQVTNDSTPQISGTATVLPGQTFRVQVNGQQFTYGATSALQLSGNIWTLQIPADKALADGTYDIIATITNISNGQSQSDTSSAELRIDSQVPRLTLSSAPVSSAYFPILSGTTEPGLEVVITLGGSVFATTADGNGVWSLSTEATPVGGSAFDPDRDGLNSLSVAVSNSLGSTNTLHSTLTIRYPYPDLQLASVSLPGGVGLSSQTLIALIRNSAPDGPVVAGHSIPSGAQWIDRYFLSPDPIFANGNDIGLGAFILPDGRGVRNGGPLASGDSRTETLQVQLPELPGDYYLIAALDNSSAINEGLGEANNIIISATPLVHVDAAYQATVSSNRDRLMAGEDVELSGLLQRIADGSPVANKPFTITLTNTTSNRVITLSGTSGADGNFSRTFRPTIEQAGEYSIAARWTPNLNEDSAPEDGFSVSGLGFVDSSFYYSTINEGASLSGSLTLRNYGPNAIEALSLSLQNLPGSWSFNTTSLPSSLASGASVSFDWQLNVPDATVLNTQFQLFANALDGSAALTASKVFGITVNPNHSVLSISPSPLSGSMLRGGQTPLDVVIRNSGSASSGPINVVLPFDWMRLNTPSTLAPLAAGETTTIHLTLAPPADLDLGLYAANIGFLDQSNVQYSAVLPFSFRATSDLTGTVHVRLLDDISLASLGTPPVTNATIDLLDGISGALLRSLRDEDGLLTFEDLPEGDYQIRANADKHNQGLQRFSVRSGSEQSVDVFLPFQGVKYTWVVVPITLSDQYQITLDTTFETEVPLPVLTITPGAISLCGELDQVGQQEVINLTLTNHGLVRASDLQFLLPSHPDFHFSLSPVAPTLEARQSEQITLTIDRIGDSGPSSIGWGQLNWAYTTFLPDVVEPIKVAKTTPLPFLLCPEPNQFPDLSGGSDGGSGGAGGGGGGGFSFNPGVVVTVPSPDPVPFVTARVGIQLSQRAVLSRAAFEGTFTLENLDPDVDLTNILVNLEVYDKDGNLVSDRFAISSPVLSGFNGGIDGTGGLGRSQTGIAQFTFLANNQAAPFEPTDYSVGGNFSYFRNDKSVSYTLIPAPITVTPAPVLSLDYFLQRDVFSDDPFTAATEASKPFVLGVLAKNSGYGAANNFTITSGQPQIVDNQTGLLIDFQLIGSSVGGQSNTINPSLTVDFGNLAPQTTKEAHWLMTSSLQGRFIDYKAKVEYINPLGFKDLAASFSQLQNVTLHELNQKVRDDRPGADLLFDYFVNDNPPVVGGDNSAKDLEPDHLYLSNGLVETVDVVQASDVVLTPTANPHEVNLTLNDPGVAPWHYLSINEPSNGVYAIASIKRADGSLLDVNNYWITDRTFPVSGRPTYEFKLHLLDYQASDASNLTYTILYSIPQTNTPPVAADDVFSVQEDRSLTISSPGVLVNDSDADGNGFFVSNYTQPGHGDVFLESDGSFTYLPNLGFAGTDSFTYTISDDIANSNTATVTITVAEGTPITSEDSYAIHQGQTLLVAPAGLLSNDSDPNGDGIEAYDYIPASHGLLVVLSDGSFSYTPNEGYVGSDSFSYRISDGVLLSEFTTVSIEVTNSAPVAVADAYSVQEGRSLTIDPPGLLRNDSDADGDGFVAFDYIPASHGSLSVLTDGSFSYTPEDGFSGTDSFSYRLFDGAQFSDFATVAITVAEGTPLASADSYSVHQGQTLLVAPAGLLSNDSDPNGDPLEVYDYTPASHGSVALLTDGSFSYTPNEGYVGSDSFSYRSSDGVLLSEFATVTIAVTNTAPSAVADAYSVLEGTTLSISAVGVLLNDRDSDGDALSVLSFTQASNGSVVLLSSGSFTYTPNAGFTGNDSFTYTISDGAALSAPATVSITVNPLPMLAISASSADKPEGNSGSTAFTFTVVRSGDTSASSTASWSVSGSGPSAATAADFSGGGFPSGSVLFEPLETTKTITVDVAGDTAVELNDGFTVTLSAPSGARLDPTASTASGLIRNDDAILAFTTFSLSQDEGNSGTTPFSFSVSRRGDTSVLASATWEVVRQGITQPDAVDFGGALPSGQVIFNPGDLTQTIAVPVTGDTGVENDESFAVVLRDPSGARLDPDASVAYGTILNDDTLLQISAASADKAEGNSGSTAFTFTVNRSGRTSGISTVAWAVTPPLSSLQADAADFGGVLPTGILSFAAEERSKTISVNISGDSAFEADETFSVQLYSPTGATLHATRFSATGAIRNDDSAGSAIFKLQGTPAVGQILSVAQVSADPDGDGPATITWQRRASDSASWQIVGSGASYQVSSSDENQQLQALVAYVDGGGFAETLTLAAGTVATMPDFSIIANTPSQNEGNIGSTNYIFTILRSGDLSASSRISWQVQGSGSNPANGADFSLNSQFPSGMIEFLPLQGSATLNVAVLGDQLFEQNETFLVALSAPVNGRLTIGQFTASSVIVNDDQPTAPTYTVSASSTTVYEGGNVSISLSTTNVVPNTKLYWEFSGTNISAGDFTNTSAFTGLTGEVTIGSDGRAAFNRGVSASSPTDIEGDELATLRFYSDAIRSQQVGNSVAITIKEMVSTATDNSDNIIGTSGPDQISGIPSGSTLRGRGSADLLTGGPGDDIFVLGDQASVYYDDGVRTSLGTGDMGLVLDFATGDRIQLYGASANYRLVSANQRLLDPTTGLSTSFAGTRIDLILSGSPTAYEAIGWVRGTSPQVGSLPLLQLANSSQFIYV